MKLKNSFLLFLAFFFSWNPSAFSQLHRIKTFHLPNELTEISGLTTFQDSLLLAINDGGNKPEIFLLNKAGEIIERVDLPQLKNVDWEALTSDQHFIYIADLGNNTQVRKDVKIYKISRAFLFNDYTIQLDSIVLNYAEQTHFPPERTAYNFDVEAVTYVDGTIHLYTKCATKPYTGISIHYVSPTTGNHTLTPENRISIGKGNYYTHSITDATTFGDKIFLLSYRKIIVIDSNTQEVLRRYSLKKFKQFEAITTNDGINFYVACEKSPLGKAKLYHYKLQQHD